MDKNRAAGKKRGAEKSHLVHGGIGAFTELLELDVVPSETGNQYRAKASWPWTYMLSRCQ